jgi:hypothetical protein
MSETDERLLSALALIAGLVDLRKPKDYREAVYMLRDIDIIVAQTLKDSGVVALAS